MAAAPVPSFAEIQKADQEEMKRNEKMLAKQIEAQKAAAVKTNSQVLQLDCSSFETTSIERVRLGRSRPRQKQSGPVQRSTSLARCHDQESAWSNQKTISTIISSSSIDKQRSTSQASSKAAKSKRPIKKWNIVLKRVSTISQSQRKSYSGTRPSTPSSPTRPTSRTPSRPRPIMPALPMPKR